MLENITDLALVVTLRLRSKFFGRALPAERLRKASPWGFPKTSKTAGIFPEDIGM